jgi:hypothetical protein
VDAAIPPIVGVANNYLTIQTFFIVSNNLTTVSAFLLTVITEVKNNRCTRQDQRHFRRFHYSSFIVSSLPKHENLRLKMS